jgi:hypothetical protein
MPRDTYYPQTFQCTRPSCGLLKKVYVWASQLSTKKIFCDCKSKTPMRIFIEDIQEGPMVRKMSKEEIKADRRARARSHFKREVLPYLSKEDRNYHLGQMKRSGENWSK